MKPLDAIYRTIVAGRIENLLLLTFRDSSNRTGADFKTLHDFNDIGLGECRARLSYAVNAFLPNRKDHPKLSYFLKFGGSLEPGLPCIFRDLLI